MKVVVVTYCLGYNYGAMLQAYATVKILESLGHEVILLNQHQPWSFGLNRKDWHNYVSFHPKVMLYKWKMLVKQQHLYKKFKPMWDSFLLSQYYGTDINAIIANPPTCDCLLTGSDQTWNTSPDRKYFAAYFLPFGDENILRISFAPSLGGVQFRDEDKSWILNHLKRYKYISVREKFDVDYLQSLIDTKVEQVPDPTLVANKKIYNLLIDKESHHKYDVVSYILGSKNSQMEKYIHSLLISSFGSLSNIRNITLQNFYCKGTRNELVTVPEWVDSIAYAGIILTNSFHAVVFSLMFNRPFVYIKFPRKEDFKNQRVRSLLEETDQSFRMVDLCDLKDLKVYNKPPMFESELNFLRNKGLSFLTKALQNR